MALWAAGLLAAGPASSAAQREAASSQAAAQPGRVQVRGEWFYVDGEPFLVKGVGYSPYRPGQVPWKHQVDPAVMERDFQRIADAGFNTIRTWAPLAPEALALADRHGLMVLQGIWVERVGAHIPQALRETMLGQIGKAVDRGKGQANILAFLVGNELLPESVFHTGVSEIETWLKQAARTVKAHDPGRAVSYANWPVLSFLDASPWDVVCFNLYPYEPSSVSHAFGFRSYVEHLKRVAAPASPLIVTEVGLSVSPGTGSKPGYGGLTAQEQATQLLALWDGLFQGGAQGGVVFEWNDEWWKNGDTGQDADTHDEGDPEEWFGLTEFAAPAQTDGVPRPALEALRTYNQAVLLSPVTGERYQDRIPVTVYATEAVARVRVRFDKGRWVAATKLNHHWWKVQLPLGQKVSPGEHRLLLEAQDADRRLLVRRERLVLVGRPATAPVLSIATDRPTYESADTLEPVRYTITVSDPEGQPLAGRPVHWAIAEPQSHNELTQERLTDEHGRVEGTYLVFEPGLVTVSAATPLDPAAPQRRVGTEALVIVRRQAGLTHLPSRWEAGVPPALAEGLRHERPAFRLADPGGERVIDYARYGRFHDAGTPQYRYEVTDWEGLAEAAGEGVYPNEGGLLKDPAYQAARAAGKLSGTHWDFIWLPDIQLAFFRWASAEEDLGVKQFFTAMELERAGLLQQAVKAYYAVLVHFPTSVGWTSFDPPTPWYVGKRARDVLDTLLRLHPELGLRLEGASVLVEHGFDNDTGNDRFSVHPGRLASVGPDAVSPPTQDLTSVPKKRETGKGRVRLVQYQNGHWQLVVDGKPFVVRGLTYYPSAVGETPDEGTLRDWVTADRNGNKTLDVFETFVDANRNNRQDRDEPTVGDFALIKRMGVNTLRLFHQNHKDTKATKALLRRLHERYGFMVMMGDFVGMYTIGSGATWEAGTDYLDPAQRRRMFESVKRMVREHKQEPYLLLWVLGNENNYGGVHGIVGGVGNAGRYPKEYYQFLNELAAWIHREDPDHPVAVGNGEWLFLDLIARHAPAIDLFGANSYRGWYGFGRSLFDAVRQQLDKPVLITEYGCPAFQTGVPRETAERDQALYHFGNWVDLLDNMAGRGDGNVIGGVVFEWSDEWWKAGQPPRALPTIQDTKANWAGPFPGGHMFEEWLGLVSQGDGGLAPFLRQLRVSYQLYQHLWREEQ